MPDATGKFRFVVQGPVGAQPAAARPQIDVAGNLWAFRSELTQFVVAGGTTQRVWSWNDFNTSGTGRRFAFGCAEIDGGRVEPDADEFPDGSKWEVSFIVDMVDIAGTDTDGYLRGYFVSFSATGDVLESFPSRKLYFTEIEDAGEVFASGGDSAIVQVAPGGSFGFYLRNSHAEDANVRVQVHAHSIDDDGDPVPAAACGPIVEISGGGDLAIRYGIDAADDGRYGYELIPEGSDAAVLVDTDEPTVCITWDVGVGTIDLTVDGVLVADSETSGCYTHTVVGGSFTYWFGGAAGDPAGTIGSLAPSCGLPCGAVPEPE